MNYSRPTKRPEESLLEDVRAAIRDALCDLSTSSGVVETQGGELAVVFFDSSEAYIVKVERAGLMVLRDE